MSRFLSPRLASLKAYTPGEQPSAAKQADTPVIIKLNTNESPYPPSSGVISALCKTQTESLNLYPDPDGSMLIGKIAQLYDVLPENVIIGNGSDELLAFTFFAFFGKGVVFPDITYGFYKVYGDLYDIPYEQIPLGADLTVNVSDYTEIGKNVILANPNAPTGIALCVEDIEKIIASNPGSLIVIDEAYVDFGACSVLPLIKKYDNLLVLHTYSKARSLAGARLAYAVAEKNIISDLNKIKYSFNPYNVNRLTQAAGFAALCDDSYYRENQAKIVETRKYTAQLLSSLGFTLTDSKANFIFAKHSRIGGEDLYLKLKSRNILIRHLTGQRTADYVRITIGTKKQMDTLISATQEILKGQQK